MVDPQWNIWYWGSKWNLHTVCWSAVRCEWGTTSVYFGITDVCFIPSRLPVFAVELQYLLQYFCQKYHLNYTYKISKKFHVGLMGFEGPILITLWTFSIWSFLQLPLWGYPRNCLCKNAVTTQWPLKLQPNSPHLSGFVFYGCFESSTELSALCNHSFQENANNWLMNLCLVITKSLL